LQAERGLLRCYGTQFSGSEDMKMTTGTASGRGKLPYNLVSVNAETEKVVYEFDGKEYNIDIHEIKMLIWLLDAAIRTRLSAAMASKKTASEKLEAARAQAEKMEKGIIGRVSKKAEEAKAKKVAAEKKLRDELSEQGLPEETIEQVVNTMLANMD